MCRIAIALVLTTAGIAARGDVPSLPASAGPRPGPVGVFEVVVTGPDEVNRLSDAGYDVASVDGNVVTVYATPEEQAQLETWGYAPIEIASPGEAASAKRSDTKALGVYHTYGALTTLLQDYATAYGAGQATNPDICRLFTLGQSVQARELWAVLITANPDVEEDEPEFKYIGSMHGDEPVGMELCVYLIDELLTNYGTDTRITDLVDTTAIWIVPQMNPDGYTSGSRYNADGWDLNRVFPAYPTDYTGTIFGGEPLHDTGRPVEAAHVMRWTADNSFVLSANLHTGALLVNYPYDEDGVGSGNDAPTPDDLLFEDVSRRYSSNNPTMWSQSSFPDGISNGSAWYAMLGGMQDWNYRYASCNEVTIELSNVKWPPEAQLPGFWSDNRESMLTYLEAAHIGVRGVVTDSGTGAPIWAEVTVEGNAHPVFTDADVGDYHRMLLPGTYNLVFRATGYCPSAAWNVAVAAGAATRVDVTLDPLPCPADVDGDGDVDAVDVQAVINAALGYAVPHDCDIDGSGSVDAVDVQQVLVADLLQ